MIENGADNEVYGEGLRIIWLTKVYIERNPFCYSQSPYFSRLRYERQLNIAIFSWCNKARLFASEFFPIESTSLAIRFGRA